MRRNRIRLNESDLHRIVKESVRKVLNEIGTSTKRDECIEHDSRRYTSKDGRQHQVGITLFGDDKGDIGTYKGEYYYYVVGNKEDTYIKGNLYIENSRLIDYDGCINLPKAVRKCLNDKGYNVD